MMMIALVLKSLCLLYCATYVYPRFFGSFSSQQSPNFLKHCRIDKDIPTPDQLFDSNPFKTSPTTCKLESQFHGTTTLAFKHNESIILCVDSKASMGQYVSSRTTRKVLPITKNIVATMAGGAADCTYWIKDVALVAERFEFEFHSPFRVTAIAKYLAAKMMEYQKAGKLLLLIAIKLQRLILYFLLIDLSLGSMIAGYDINGPECKFLQNTFRKENLIRNFFLFQCFMWIVAVLVFHMICFVLVLVQGMPTLS